MAKETRDEPSRILDIIKELSGSPRHAGSQVSQKATELVRGRIEATGMYSVEFQSFEFSQYIPKHWELSIAGRPYKCLPSLCSAAAGKSGLIADLCDGRSDVEGKIVLVPVEKVHESISVEKVSSKGAVGALIFQKNGPLYAGRVKYPQSSIPAMSISSEDGLALSLALRRNEKLRCFIRLDSKLQRSYGKNILGAPRVGKQGAIYVAHRDSRIFSPGAIDNATGSALLLHVVERHSPNYVLSTDAEEYGLIGARSFVRTLGEQLATKEVVNLDSVGAGNLCLVTESRGGKLSSRLNSKISAVAAASDIQLGSLTIPRGSDCDEFASNGYQASWIRAYPSPSATTVDDTYKHVRPTVIMKAMKLLNALVGIQR